MATYDIIDWKHTGAETEIWDVRSPSEYAEDHVPGAINVPVLTDLEREEVGTLYRRDPFQARKLGAALIAENVAKLLRTSLRERDGSLHPLIYCWRGGLRSQSIATILSHVGWRVNLLRGGYKSYRDAVREGLDTLPCSLEFRVLAGPTGSGKTKLLQQLKLAGHQSIDLEGIASHRGSLLGEIPNHPQPKQKHFESLVYQQLNAFSSDQPVWIEAESHRIGSLHIPDQLFKKMRHSEVVILDVPRAERVKHLLEHYDTWTKEPDTLIEKLKFLTRLRSKATIEHWISLVQQERWSAFTDELLEFHYDPTYSNALNRFEGPRHHLTLDSLTQTSEAIQTLVGLAHAK